MHTTRQSRRLRRRAVKPLIPPLAATLLLGAGLAVPASAREGLPFRDPALPVQARVDDLVKRLTLDEKVGLLHQYQAPVPRLGIKAFKTGTEALHGYAWTSDAKGAQLYAKGTVFPQAIGLASTWDPALVQRVGQAVGTEARGYHSTNDDRQLWGLNVWAPVVNLLRDPRWGRNEEGYSEDPGLTGAISTAYGRGLTGGDPDHLLTAPTLKHYLANDNEVRRATTDAQVRDRVLNEYDRQAFRPALAADAATGVMSAYNLVNGRPNAVNPDLGTVVRSWTGRDLMNVTDAGLSDSLAGPGADPNWNQRYYPDTTSGDAAILKAGNDSLTIGNGDSGPTVAAVRDALAKGLLKPSDVDGAARHILAVRVRLGEFDPGGGRYGKITMADVGTDANRRLNRQVAAASAVLLKNAERTLPFDAATTRKVAVVGPLAANVYADWYGPELSYKVTPVDGVKAKLGPSATVSTVTGDDRIALKDVRTGKYVTAGTGDSGARLALSDARPAATSEFDVTDWGDGIKTLRSAANGRYVGAGGGGFVNDQVAPNGWFVQQQFKLEKQAGGDYVLRYAGYDTAESWFGSGDYVKAGADGALTLTKTAAEAAHFAKETVVSGPAAVADAVRGQDQAVVVVGSNPFVNGRENHDRPSIDLPAGQRAIVQAALRANPRTTVVLQNSYPTAITWEQKHAPAILWTSHTGAETGNALADVLFGDVNPSGHLTQTWYRSDAQLPDILDYDIIKANRTYLYFKGAPLYPFGHGLSYTDFRYGAAKVVRDGDTVEVTVPVTNTGSRAGDEVVQLYTHQRTSRDKEPLKQLRTFQKVHLEPGRTANVRLRVKTSDLAHWDVTRSKWTVESSVYDLLVGSSSADIRARASVRVEGETIPARDLSRTTRAEAFDDYSGVRLVDESKASGTAVGGPGWIEFRDAVVSGRGITLSAANAGSSDASVQVRVGGPDGRLLGTATVPPTGDRYTYKQVTATLAGMSGKRDLYLVLGGDVRVSTFALTR